MSKLFKNLKGLFIEEDESNQSSASPAANKVEGKTNPANKKTQPNPINLEQIKSAPGEMNAKFSKILLQAIEKNNLEGFDYLEYKNGLKSLSTMNMDDATRYKSAFAMAATMGTTKDNLVRSAKHYQNILSTEKKHFEKAVEQQMQVKVVGRKQEMKAWEQEIKKKQNQIAQLNKEIDALKAKVNKVSGSLDQEAQKVRKTQLDFLASYDHIYQQIEKDIQKINQYLTA